MIGHLIADYCDGRRDARHGRERARRVTAAGVLAENQRTRAAYLQGLEDERARMRAAGRLAQGLLDLEASAPDAETLT